ncbi:unnamed protein product, partial [Didymodactylos carnosus]
YASIHELQSTVWSHCQMDLKAAIGYDRELFTIKDNTCPEFHSLFDKRKDPFLSYNILKLLNKLWRTINHYFAAQIQLTRNHVPLLAIESTFCLDVKRCEWIPAIVMKRENSTIIQEIEMRQPRDVYLFQMDNFLQQYFPHLDSTKISLTEVELITNILEFKQNVKQSDMLVLLLHWATQLPKEELESFVVRHTFIPCPSLSARCSFADLCQNLSKIYKYIGQEYLSRFIEWPIIFNGSEFLFSHQFYWSDETTLLNKYSQEERQSLQMHYKNDVELQTLFTNTFHIDLHPLVKDFIPVLNYFIKLNELTQDQLRDVWKLFVIITREDDVFDMTDRPFIPCRSTAPMSVKWVKLDEKPLMSNDNEMAQLFQDILPIIKLPSKLSD